VHYLATGASTAGQFGLYRWDMAATPSAPDPHLHSPNAESFYVLGHRPLPPRQPLGSTARDFLFVPQGGIHAFRHDSGQPSDVDAAAARPRLTVQ